MSERKTFTINDVEWSRVSSTSELWWISDDRDSWQRFGGPIACLAKAHAAALDEIDRLKAENEKATTAAGDVEIFRADAEQLQQDCEVMARRSERLKEDNERLDRARRNAESNADVWRAKSEEFEKSLRIAVSRGKEEEVTLLSERKTFTIGDLVFLDAGTSDRPWWKATKDGWEIIQGGEPTGAFGILCAAHYEAIGEIRRLNGLHASGQKELEDLVNQLCDFDKRLEQNDAEIRQFKKDGYEKDAEIERLKAENERLKASALEMAMSRAAFSSVDRADAASTDNDYTTTSPFHNDRARDVWFRGLWIGTAPDVEHATALIKQHRADKQRMRTIAPNSETDYTMRTADGEDYGHPDDRTRDVYYRGERIGSAPDRASGRALIERHKVEMAAAADRRKPESRQGMVVPGKPAGLSEEEQRRWIEKLDQEITDAIDAGSGESHILAHIRRIVQLLG